MREGMGGRGGMDRVIKKAGFIAWIIDTLNGLYIAKQRQKEIEQKYKNRVNMFSKLCLFG
jgi:hypothetical protein